MSAVVHSLDDYGRASEASRTSAPFLCEEAGTVSLHFEMDGVQSQMCVDSPDLLALGYTRTMMGFLLFHEHPRHIGMIGLGGGSLPKYCYRHLPQTRISVAEISPEVIALRGCFHVPHDDHRFTVLCEDGADFVNRHRRQFDVLIVDGFDISGQPPQLCSRHFYDDCYSALAPDGVLVVNMCDCHFDALIFRMRRSFQDRVIVIDPEDSSNMIVFAIKGDIQVPQYEQLLERQKFLEHGHPIDFTRTVQQLQQECEKGLWQSSLSADRCTADRFFS